MPWAEDVRVFYVAVETTKGTAIATMATNGSPLLVFDGHLESAAEYVRRNGCGVHVGNTITGKHLAEVGKFTGKVEMRGDGTDGLQAGVDVLLQGAGFKKTAGATDVYALPDLYSDRKTITIAEYAGTTTSGEAIYRVLKGAMGTIKFTGDFGDRLMMEVDFSGILETETSTSISLPSTFDPGSAAPMLLGSGAFTVNGQATADYARWGTFNLDIQGMISPFKGGGGTDGIIHFDQPNNNPEVSGDPLDVAVATYGFDALRRAGTEHGIYCAVTDGTVEVTFALPKVQIVEANPAGRDGYRTRDYVGQCNYDSSEATAVKINVAAAA